MQGLRTGLPSIPPPNLEEPNPGLTKTKTLLASSSDWRLVAAQALRDRGEWVKTHLAPPLCLLPMASIDLTSIAFATDVSQINGLEATTGLLEGGGEWV